MATEDGRYRKVQSTGSKHEGQWVTIIHDCAVPSQRDITEARAVIGSVWKCGSCEDKWKLTLWGNRGQDTEELSWLRITEHKE
jgi:hypothetical protein